MIEFDAVSSGSTLPGTSITFSHTCSGNNRILLVGVQKNNDTNDTITGVTYASTSMTLITSIPTGNFRTYLFYLLNPASGANNIVVSASQSDYLRAISASYTGARQSGQPNAFGSANVAPGTSLTTTINVVNSGCWTISFIGNDGALDLVPSTGVAIERATVGNVVSLGDSNGTVPTGSNSHAWTFSSQDAGMIMVSIAPVGSGAGVFFHNWL